MWKIKEQDVPSRGNSKIPLIMPHILLYIEVGIDNCFKSQNVNTDPIRLI